MRTLGWVPRELAAPEVSTDTQWCLREPILRLLGACGVTPLHELLDQAHTARVEPAAPIETTHTQPTLKPPPDLQEG